MYADQNILYFNEGSGHVVFICNDMGILNIDLNNNNLDYNNYDKDDTNTIILIKLLAWYFKFGKWKALKKELNGEFMPVAWYPNRWWNFCVSGDEKKEIEPIFTE